MGVKMWGGASGPLAQKWGFARPIRANRAHPSYL